MAIQSIMGRGPPSSHGAFNMLPIEMNWAIAGFLDSDKDICTFRLICRHTRDAIEGNNLSFWRIKFREKYAHADNAKIANVDLKAKYQERSKRLGRGVSEDFQMQGHGRSELKLLNVIRSLILESFQGTHGYDKHGRPLCHNQERLMNFILNSKNLLGIRPRPSSPKAKAKGHEKPNPFFVAVQIMCAQLLFTMEAPKYDIISFEDSQKMVYARMTEEPMFTGHGNIQVNMTWTLHCLSFFRHHMVREEAQSLYTSMEALNIGDWPSAWREPLREVCYPLSKKWNGTYSYLDNSELSRLRRPAGRKSQDPDEYFVDKNIENGGKIQSLELDFVEDGKLVWPDAFENRLQSLIPTMVPRTRAQHRHSSAPKNPISIRIQGAGLDHQDHFFASGWLNPLAPQHGIPGWQRVTMMKHFVQDYDQVLDDDLWAYEGVVLPGGRIMLGRWWFANEERDTPHYGSYCGPFILWAVDDE